MWRCGAQRRHSPCREGGVPVCEGRGSTLHTLLCPGLIRGLQHRCVRWQPHGRTCAGLVLCKVLAKSKSALAHVAASRRLRGGAAMHEQPHRMTALQRACRAGTTSAASATATSRWRTASGRRWTRRPSSTSSTSCCWSGCGRRRPPAAHTVGASMQRLGHRQSCHTYAVHA